MDIKSKIEQILVRFDDCELQSNEQLSASLYYAYCSLPIYDSSEVDLRVRTATSINFKKIRRDSWEIDLADNIAKIFRCIVSIKEIVGNTSGSKPRKIYTFEFVGVEDDPEIASNIFNRLYGAMIYKCRSTFKRSLDKVFSKKPKAYAAASCGRSNKESTNRADNEIKNLVEDISDFSSSLNANEFSDLITRHFMREHHQGLPS
ncbi:hypothetical protein HYG89_05370 [Acinetobacter sp. SwsAc5]|uniref:DUF7168 domain-containing protein n=1 Tax=Acinetobacter sp. SwsAc5 TaxID=2749438 RepID=UPI0015BD09F7|nr:hypothetical protein [Acinetobacter sp. SwsAc5]NWK51998.1 hypothetical protein [Acinetobacter sp. SwsAc5]